MEKMNLVRRSILQCPILFKIMCKFFNFWVLELQLKLLLFMQNYYLNKLNS